MRILLPIICWYPDQHFTTIINPLRAHTYINTLSASCYQLAFSLKPAADSIATLDSNCTSRSCLIELTRSRNWCHLTYWSWETMRQNISPPSPTPTHLSSIFFSLIHITIFFYLPCYCVLIARFFPHFFHHPLVSVSSPQNDMKRILLIWLNEYIHQRNTHFLRLYF